MLYVVYNKRTKNETVFITHFHRRRHPYERTAPPEGVCQYHNKEHFLHLRYTVLQDSKNPLYFFLPALYDKTTNK